MFKQGFRQALADRQKSVNSLLCVGLDPFKEHIPHHIRARHIHDENMPESLKAPYVRRAMSEWMQGVVDATAPFACMFKPQRAHWEALGAEGELRLIIEYIRREYPDIPVFLDCKRGDIDRTQTQYREAHFTLDGVDGMNYNGYMGMGTLKSLIDPSHIGRALVGLGRTSNPDAWEFQELTLSDGRKVWQCMLGQIRTWSSDLGVLENAGVVMGAAHKDPFDPGKIYSNHLKIARGMVGKTLWFLIPGIGTQGGFIEETVSASFRGPGSVAINNSSAISNASAGEDFKEAAAKVAEDTRDKIRVAGGNC